MTGGATDADFRSVARAIDALRRGWWVRIVGADGALDVLAVESATDASLVEAAVAGVLISGERAATLKLANQRAAAHAGAVLVSRIAAIAPAIALADPALDLATPMKGPFVTAPVNDPVAADAAILLARHAGLLPALFVGSVVDTDITTVTPHAVVDFAAPAHLTIAARAALPVAASEAGELVAFRSSFDPREHVALVLGQRDGTPPVVRLHSECLTGDVLGSLKCDCGPQLDAALADIAGAQWGVLLYLRQEGRGIGLINKLRAYQLQDQGFDTVDANVRLGFPVEARDFGIAARMLALLNIDAVRLMTNNPDKVAQLEQAGVRVVERLPLALPTNAHNHRYLATKRDRTGHVL